MRNAGIPIISDAAKGIEKIASSFWDGVTVVWGFAWDNILEPVMEPIFNALGFTDEDVASVALSTFPLFDEAFAFDKGKDIFIKSVITDQSIFDAFTNVILKGNHKSVVKFHKYGKEEYTLGLPTLTGSTARSFNFNVAIMNVWNNYCNHYGFPKTYTTVESLPVTNAQYDLDTIPIIDQVKSYLYKNQNYYNNKETITVSGVDRFVAWYTLTVDTSVSGGQTNASTTIGSYIYNYSNVTNTGTIASPRPELFNLVHSVAHGTYYFSADGTSWSYVPNAGYYNYMGIPDGEVIAYSESITFDTPTVTYILDTSYTVNRNYVTTSFNLFNILARRFFYAVQVTDSDFNTKDTNTTHYLELVFTPESYLDFTGEGTSDFDYNKYGEKYLEILPVIPVKQLGSWVNADKTSDTYLTSKKLLKLINLDIDVVCDSVRDSNEESDGQIQTATVHLGINLNTENFYTKQYVYRFINFLFFNSFVSKADYDGYISDKEANVDNEDWVDKGTPLNTFIATEGLYNKSLTYNYISRTEVVSVDTEKVGHTEITLIGDADLRVRHWVTQTNYVELFVKNFVGASLIRIEGTKKVDFASMQYSDDSFVIPIVYGVYESFKTLEKEAIITRSYYMTVYAGAYETLEWYQTPEFLQFISIVIIVVVTIVTIGSGTKAAVAIMNALIAYATTKLVIFVLLKIFEATDNEFIRGIAVILAVTVIVLSGGQGIGDAAGILGLVQAASVVGGEYMKFQMKEDAEATKDFLEQVDNQLEALQEQYGYMFDTSQGLLDMYSPYYAESPDVFFTRAIDMDTTEIASSIPELSLNTDIHSTLKI